MRTLFQLYNQLRSLRKGRPSFSYCANQPFERVWDSGSLGSSADRAAKANEANRHGMHTANSKLEGECCPKSSQDVWGNRKRMRAQFWGEAH